jgi:hypothetical protein
MTLAKHALAAQNRQPNPPSAVVQRVAGVADQKFAAFRNVRWSPSHFEALNVFAAEQMNMAGEGVLVYSTVRGNVRNKNALVMSIEGTDDSFIVQVDTRLSRVPQGSRWLVVGFVMPQVLNIKNQTRSIDQNARVVLTHYLLSVR